MPEQNKPKRLLEDVAEQTELCHMSTKMHVNATAEPLKAEQKGFVITAQDLASALEKAIERHVKEQIDTDRDVILRRAFQGCI